MERLVLALSGVWVWMTRRSRIDAYIAAAKTLEFARFHLLEEFASRASTTDRGTLMEHQLEALSLLESHAAKTYMAVVQLSRFGSCCSFVAEELRRQPLPERAHVPSAVKAMPAIIPFPLAPAVAPRFAYVRVRYRLPSAVAIRAIARRFFRAEGSGAVWQGRALKASEPQAPLKAA